MRGGRRGVAAAAARGGVVLLALALLAIGIGEDWRLRHEDNGAFHTSLALSHVRLGLAGTRAHNLLFDPATGRTAFYGHHPPGPGLILAGAFSLTGSARPWVARGAAIAFHLGSLGLLLLLLGRFLPPSGAVLGGLYFAVAPMGAFYGRMPNFEPFALFAVLLQLVGWVDTRLGRGRRGLPILALGVVLGGLVDWGPFFFAGAVVAVEASDLLRRRVSSPAALLVAGGAAILVGLLDLWHLRWAGDGTLSPLGAVLASSAPGAASHGDAVDWLEGQAENFRRYFAHAGVLASLAAAAAVALPRTPAGRALLGAPHAAVLKRLLAVTGASAAAYLLAAPSWAMVHHYWQFFFLPFCALSVALLLAFLLGPLGARGRLLPRALAVLLLAELVATSAYVLAVRHGREERYAVETTRALRASWLAP